MKNIKNTKKIHNKKNKKMSDKFSYVHAVSDGCKVIIIVVTL